jgi:hypothetical protein
MGGSLSLRRLLIVIPAYILGGLGIGAGVAAGSMDVQWAWAIYDLRVDGNSHGSWVSTVIGNSGSWVFVEPGEPLPEPDWLDWPAPRTHRT